MPYFRNRPGADAGHGKEVQELTERTHEKTKIRQSLPQGDSDGYDGFCAVMAQNRARR